MIKESFVVTRGEMERVLAEADVDVGVASAKVEHLRPAFAAAENDLENKCAQVFVWTELFEQDKRDLQTAKATLAEAENTQSMENAKASEMQKTKDSVERAMEESGVWEISPEARQCEQAISNVARIPGFEDMLEFIPLADTKSSDDCSEVLHKFKADVSKRMADLCEEITNIKTSQAAIVSNMAAAVRETQAKHEVSIWALEYAYTAQETSQAAEEVARSAFNSAVLENDALVSVRDARQNELVTFNEGALEAFQKLEECSVLSDMPHNSNDVDVDGSLLESVIPEILVPADQMLTSELDVSTAFAEKNVLPETEAAPLVTGVAGG